MVSTKKTQDIWVFDFDGTLCDSYERFVKFEHMFRMEHPTTNRHWSPQQWDELNAESINDPPNWPTVSLMNMLIDNGAHVEIWTARNESAREVSERWLSMWVGSGWKRLLMREEDDRQPDHELKESWLLRSREEGFRVVAVLEDRDSVVEMYRSHGVVCWQVAKGEY